MTLGKEEEKQGGGKGKELLKKNDRGKRVNIDPS
jgi:hypothetical protein